MYCILVCVRCVVCIAFIYYYICLFACDGKLVPSELGLDGQLGNTKSCCEEAILVFWAHWLCTCTLCECCPSVLQDLLQVGLGLMISWVTQRLAVKNNRRLLWSELICCAHARFVNVV